MEQPEQRQEEENKLNQTTNEIEESKEQEQQQKQKLICNCCKKEFKSLQVCSACKKVFYCDTKCQRKDWPTHKASCSFKKTIKQEQQKQPQKTTEKDWKDLSFHEFQQKFGDGQKFQQQEQIYVPSKYAEKFQDKLKERQEKTPILVEFTNEKSKDCLTLKSLESLQQSYSDICEKELIDLEISNREQRRKFFKKGSEKQYVDCVLNLFQEKDQALKSSQDEVLRALSIKVDLVENTIKQFMKEGKQREIQQMMGQIQQKQKEVLVSQSPVKDIEQISKVFKFQKEKLDKEQPFFIKFIDQLNLPMQLMQDVVPILISLILLDHTYEEFKLEEEDFYDHLKEPNNWTKELAELEKDINQGTFKIIQEFIQQKMKNKF